MNRLRSFAEGDAGPSFDLGLPSSEHLHGPGEEPEETDRELVSEDDGASTKTKVKVPGKMEVEREVALEVGSLDVHFWLHNMLLNHHSIH